MNFLEMSEVVLDSVEYWNKCASDHYGRNDEEFTVSCMMTDTVWINSKTAGGDSPFIRIINNPHNGYPVSIYLGGDNDLCRPSIVEASSSLKDILYIIGKWVVVNAI